MGKLILAITISISTLKLFGQNIPQNCSVVVGADNQNIIVGNNEDWLHPFTSVFFYPAHENKLGCILFGFSFSETNQGYCGGVNEKGLFIDGLGIPSTNWKPDQNKKSLETISDFDGNLESYILQHYGTMDEVISFFNTYNVIHLTTGKFVIADKSGKSIVVEWGQNQLQILERKGTFQIATTFVQSDFEEGAYPDYRYTLAEQIFKGNKNPITKTKIKEILSAIHWEELENHPTTTLYSYICDLKQGVLYVYNFHNYEVEAQINIKEELKSKKRVVPLISLFPYETYSEKIWKKMKVVSMLVEIIETNGLEGQNGFIQTMNRWKGSPIFNYYRLTEDQFIEIADALRSKGNFADARSIVEFAITEYPNSINLENRLAMAHYNAGDFTSAVKNFKNLLVKNPDNKNAKWYLDYINALNNPALIDLKKLELLKGQFGERRLFIENGKFFYQNGNGAKRELIPVNDELFVLTDLDYFRIRIIKEGNNIKAIEGIYLDGRIIQYNKDE